jgi:hypothetical protein
MSDEVAKRGMLVVILEQLAKAPITQASEKVIAEAVAATTRGLEHFDDRSLYDIVQRVATDNVVMVDISKFVFTLCNLDAHYLRPPPSEGKS